MSYQYGAFVLSDGINYLLQVKNFDLPQYQQTLFQPGRLEGVKKTGERLNSKQIDVTITVIGSDRSDLESKLDALYQALSARQQSLTLHALDTRYYIADAVAGKAQLAPGRLRGVQVPVSFTLLQPFAYAAAASNQTFNTLLMPAVVGQTNVWQLPVANNPLLVTGGGNFFARPTVTIFNATPSNATTLTAGVTSGTPYTSLSVAALSAAATAGQVFLLVNGSGQIQRVTLAANASLGATTLSVNSFTPSGTFASGNFCGLDIYLQGFTLSQDPDGQVLTVTGLGAQAVGTSGSLVIASDPTQSGGDTVVVAGSSTYIAFSGAFGVMEPTATQWFLQVTCSNQPTLNVQFTWTPRWLA